jgi:hypothetical protein
VSAWLANVVALAAAAALVTAWALALLWRVGSWHIAPAATLTIDEGLRVGSQAPELACTATDGADMHLGFEGTWSFVVFGTEACGPCYQLLAAAPKHPATRSLRRVYVVDGAISDLSPEALESWEVYTYHDETSAREMWRAPVSPYFHVVDPRGRVAAKGVANLPEHLDRLLSLRPVALGQPAPRILSVEHT